MANPLKGFDALGTAAVVSPPINLSAVLASVSVPAKWTVAGVDVDVSDLDNSALPLVALDVGDAVDADRFVAASTIAQGGGLLEYRPESGAYYRYTAASAVRVTVRAAPASGVAGAIGVTVYGYASADIADVVRATLQALGVLAEGETARFEDAALAQEALAEVHEVLRGKGLANRQDMAWPLTSIPMFAFRPYAVLAGNLLADTFGVSAQRAQRIAARAVEAEREMRRQTRVAYSDNPVPLEPYGVPAIQLDYGALA